MNSAVISLFFIALFGWLGYKIFKVLDKELKEGNDKMNEFDQPISDLIEQLQRLKDMHGDVPVHVLYRNEGGTCWGFFTHKFEYPIFDSNTNAVYI